jgi:hypothetical protein
LSAVCVSLQCACVVSLLTFSIQFPFHQIPLPIRVRVGVSDGFGPSPKNQHLAHPWSIDQLALCCMVCYSVDSILLAAMLLYEVSKAWMVKSKVKATTSHKTMVGHHYGGILILDNQKWPRKYSKQCWFLIAVRCKTLLKPIRAIIRSGVHSFETC